MNINDFDYNLPENLIAQTPIENRSESKLLVMDRKTGEIPEFDSFKLKIFTKH